MWRVAVGVWRPLAFRQAFGARLIPTSWDTKAPLSRLMSKYAKVHESLNGPGDSRPTAMEIMEDEKMLGKLGGKVCIVTGGSSGIGIG